MEFKSRICIFISLFFLTLPTPAFAASKNCVQYLRQHGYPVPMNPKISAITLPVKSTDLPPEGKVALIVTRESRWGHVRMAVVKGGKLINVIDSVNGKTPVEINRMLYKGWVYLM